jgi:hypothetical protein
MRIWRNTILAVVGIAGLAIFFSCQPVDATAPVVVIVSPGNGETLAQGNIAVKVHATDDKAMSRVEFYVDNTLKSTDSLADADTWRWTWDATSESLSHAIKVKAYDSIGNVAEKTNTIYIRAAGVGTIHDHDISSDETWYPSGNPHWVTQGISVANGAKLTIMPGCLVKFYTGTDVGLLIGNTTTGELVAVGKPDSLITFTSNAATPQPGDWFGIRFANADRPTSHLSYCVIDYGGYADGGAISPTWYSSVSVDHCTIKRSAGNGIYTDDHDGRVTNFTGNTITNCAKYPMDAWPNNVRHLGTGNTLTGNGFDYIVVRNGGVESTGTWLKQSVPYLVHDGSDVGLGGDDNPVLTIERGTTIKFGIGSSMTVGYTVNATLIANGDSLNPITFTSVASVPQAGDWRFLWLAMGPLATQSSLTYCKILYAGGVSNEGNLLITGEATPVVQHCEIGYSQTYGIWLDGAVYPDPATLRAENNIHDCASGDIRVPPAK